MIRSRLSKTTAFRLSLLYLALFLSGFMALGLGVYFLSMRTLDEHLRDVLGSAIVQLQNDYKSEGISELIKEIAERENVTSWNTPSFALIDRSGKRLAGTLPPHDYKTGFQVFPGPPEFDEPTEAQLIFAEGASISGGYLLVSGEDGDYINDFGETVIGAFFWSALLVSIVGVSCGLYLSRSFLKKAERITTSAQIIIDGDISHRLAVSSANDELDELARLINRMLDQINNLLEDVRQVSSDIAHDLRTPISHLRQHLDDALRRSSSVEQYRTNIDSAIRELDTILATFAGLLRIAQIEAGARRGGFKLVDLSSIVRNVTDALAPVAEETKRRLNLQIENEIQLSGDQELLTQMIFNLVENAVRHTPEGSRISISLRASDGNSELVVSDNGPGIPKELREKVFQRFYRMEKSRSTPGNGLGLSIVKAIADLHEARVTLSDSAPGLKIVVRFLRSGCQSCPVNTGT
jgi:signal transduction histidine kinase